jgi:hypothetical protein
MSDDTPTQRFDAPPTGAATASKPNRLVPLLIIVGLILIAAIVVLVLVLVSRPANPQPAAVTSPSPTPTLTAPPPVVNPTPTPTPSQSHTSAPPPPQSTDAQFTTFVVQKAINSCSSGPYYTGTPPIVKVTWATIRANSAWIVQGTSDAADSGFMQIPLSGNESDFQYPIDFNCDAPDATFTITLVGTNGKHVSKHWTIQNTSPGQ